MEKFIKFKDQKLDAEETLKRAQENFVQMDDRRSIREFSSKDVPKSVIELLIKTASTAPSGAHKQPWTFCAVSSMEIKTKIRNAAELEERENYSGRMSDAWLKDLEPFGTDSEKPFLEIAPWLIVVFKKAYDLVGGEKKKNYYVNESVGIATGMLISAIHRAGLVTLTHTPSPMNFLSDVLKRPENERAYLLLPVGYPAEGTMVPNIERKGLAEMSEFY